MSSKKKTILVALLAALVASTGLYAQGAREIAEGERVAKVISATTGEDGVTELLVQEEDGNVILYRADASTNVSVPMGQIGEGSVLAIRDNGIATMSIPAQMWATDIRDLTLGVNLGAYSFTFSEPTGAGAAVAQEATAEAAANPAPWDYQLPESVEGLFSYAYGYDILESFLAQGVTFRGSWFVRGALDLHSGAEPLIPVEEMGTIVDDYINTVYAVGAEETAGPVPASLDEILALELGDDLSDRFSYSYGYATAWQDLAYGLFVQANDFAIGALTSMFGYDPLMDLTARNQAVNDYMAVLQAEYEAWLNELAAANLEEANNFLVENARAEGVVTTASGLQLEVVTEGDGAQPASDSTVTVNYSLRDLDGNLLDQGENASFPVSGVIPGFAEAVMSMKVGGETIAYVHPDLGYGEYGSGSVGPNALLVFDIELLGIEEPETVTE